MEPALSGVIHKEKLQLKHLPDFLRYVRDQRLDGYLRLQLHYSREYELPLLRFFKEFSEEDLISIGLTGALEFFDAVIDLKSVEYIHQQKESWLSNNLPHLIDKSAVAPEDIFLVSAIRKKALFHFLSEFTDDPKVLQCVHDEMDEFITVLNLTLSSALSSVLREKFQQEEKVKANEERLRLALEATRLGTWDFDLNSGVIEVSSRIREIYGLAADEPVTYDLIKDLYHPEDRDEQVMIVRRILSAAAHNRTYERELRIQRADDKSIRWIRVNGYVLLNEQDVPFRIIGTILDITERKHLESQLREREFQFRQLADSMPQMAWITLADGTITYFNQKWIEYTGKDVQDVTYEWGVLLHPEDAEKSRVAWMESLATGSLYEIEYRLLHKASNVYRWFLTRALPVKNSRGEIMKWFGTCTDIHDYKLAEESLQMQARVLNSMEEGVSIADENGFILYTNPAEDRMFGYGPGELPGKHVTVQNAYDEPENKERVENVMEILKLEGSWSGEWNNKRKDGTTFNTFSHITSLNLDNRRLLVCVQRDITMEKAHQAALLESELRFRTLADHAPMFVWISDAEGKLDYFNDEVERFVGPSADELKTNGWIVICHPEDQGKFTEAGRALREEGKALEVECRLKNREGKFRWVLLRAAPRMQDGKLIGMTGTGLDIEDRKRLTGALETKVEERTRELMETNAKLERSNRELEQFAYVASHDLQEPLRKIKAFGDMLAGRYKEGLGPEGVDMIGRMQSASDRMRILIEDLLAFSRVSREPQHKTVDLDRLIKEVLFDLDTTIQEKQASLKIDALPSIAGDELQLRQLFQNLLSNALKFSREGVRPEISVTITKTNGLSSGFDVTKADQQREFYLLAFRDNGIGFEQQYADKIFQVFQRLHGRMEYPGSGVGLSIVQKVVDNHKGYVKAEGAPGEGALFLLLLRAE